MDYSSSANTQQDKAVLFADVSGSTHLYEVLGDTLAFTAINDCLNILRHITFTHSGQTIKTIGDEIMAVFPDALTAVQAACEMQLAISAQPPIENTHVAIRIGFHFGPVLENAHDNDVFGDTVNVAARMARIAKAQQIITTGTTAAMLPPIVYASTRTFTSLSVKGKAEDIEVREVIWQASDEMTMMVSSNSAVKTADTSLTLTYRGNKFIVDAQHPTVVIGRDDHMDLVVQDLRASRMHARVERRRDKYVFVDLSSNGSYIATKGEAEVELRREEFVFRESGTISLGHTFQVDPTEFIEFALSD